MALAADPDRPVHLVAPEALSVNHRMLRRVSTVALVLVAVVAAAVVTVPQAAAACWCANESLERRIEKAEAVAVIETTTQADGSAMPNTWNARIVEVFKGNPPEAILVAGGPVDSFCGNFELTAGMVMGVIINGETASVGPCSGAISQETLEALFSPIEQPDFADGAALVVGLERPGARIALLDASGSVIAHGDERRTVRQVAACPAGDVFVSVVVDDARGGGGSLVVRDVGSLEVVSERRTGTSDSDAQDFECHSEDGSVVSYLVPRLRNRAGRERSPDRAESVVHLWDGEAHVSFRAGAATELLVDVANDAGYVIDGQGRGAVERWQLSTGSRTARFDMGGLDVRALVADPTDGSVVGFAGKIGTKRAFMIRIGSDAEVGSSAGSTSPWVEVGERRSSSSVGCSTARWSTKSVPDSPGRCRSWRVSIRSSTPSPAIYGRVPRTSFRRPTSRSTSTHLSTRDGGGS